MVAAWGEIVTADDTFSPKAATYPVCKSGGPLVPSIAPRRTPSIRHLQMRGLSGCSFKNVSQLCLFESNLIHLPPSSHHKPILRPPRNRWRWRRMRYVDDSTYTSYIYATRVLCRWINSIIEDNTVLVDAPVWRKISPIFPMKFTVFVRLPQPQLGNRIFTFIFKNRPMVIDDNRAHPRVHTAR